MEGMNGGAWQYNYEIESGWQYKYAHTKQCISNFKNWLTLD